MGAIEKGGDSEINLPVGPYDVQPNGQSVSHSALGTQTGQTESQCFRKAVMIIDSLKVMVSKFLIPLDRSKTNGTDAIPV